jgi:hypothetical protein
MLICFCYFLLPMVAAAGGFFDVNVPPLFPLLQCYLRLLVLFRNPFDISLDNFGQYVSDDAELILAQTGRYFGKDGITEYIRFVVAENSKYFKSSVREGTWADFVEYDKEAGQCIFRFYLYGKSSMDPDFTSSTGVEGDLPSAVMGKLFLNYHDGLLDDIHVFIPENVLDLLFNNFLVSDNTRNFICGVREGPCADYLAEDPPLDCAGALANLPSSTNEIYFDGKSQGCRALHAIFAETNPKHCAHISFAPQTDSDGVIKCQESEGIKVTDVFSEQDLDAIDKFCKKNEIEDVCGTILQ